MAPQLPRLPTKTYTFPVKPSDPAVTIFNSTIQQKTVDILVTSKAPWTTVSLLMRGPDPKGIQNCMPTIVIGTSKDVRLSLWKAVIAKVDAEVKSAGMIAAVEVLGVQVVKAKVLDVPYDNIPRLGADIGPRDLSSQGTLGGLVKVQVHDPPFLAGMTCDHVVNTFSKQQTFGAAAKRDVVMPSNWSHAETVEPYLNARKALGNLPLNRDDVAEMNDILGQILTQTRPLSHETWPGTAIYEVALLEAAVQDGDGNLVESCLTNIPPACQQRARAQAALRKIGIWRFKQWATPFETAVSADRTIGSVVYASSRRAFEPKEGVTDQPCVLDWAFIKMAAPPKRPMGINDLTPLRALARNSPETVNSRLATGGPADHVRALSKLTANEPVFMHGAITTCMGRVNCTKMAFNAVALDLIHEKATYRPAVTFENTVYAEAVDANGLLRGGRDDYHVPFGVRGDSGSWIINMDSDVVGIYWGFTEYFSNGVLDWIEGVVTDMPVIRESMWQLYSATISLP